MSHIFLSNFKSKDDQENSGSSRTSESTPNSHDAEAGFVPMCAPGSRINGMVDENSDNFIVHEEVECDDKYNRRATLTPEQRGLSKVSDMYDRDHKGYLDPTEEAMRRMDSKNLGFLDNSKVYQIMHSLQTEQQKSQELIESLQREHQKSMSLKRGIVLMSVFAFVLAISNIGTSFAAARLAKDTTISGDEMVTTSTGVRVSTTPKNIVLRVNEVQTDDASRRRQLQQISDLVCGNVAEGVQCVVAGQIDYADAVALYQQFCPAYPAVSSVAECANIGLSQVILQCGTRITKILGGSQFPTRGIPTSDGSSLVFPAASTYTREGTPSSDYFQGIQSFSVPVTTSTVTTSAPTSTAAPVYSFTATTQPPVAQVQQVTAYENCDEYIFFKLYCPQNPDGSFTSGCFMIHTFSTNAPHCPGTVQLCENTGVSTPVYRRLGGKRVN